MPSILAWLDFAESDRQKAMDVIDLFREKSTVDELGFAPIRDSLADCLFPGTSTIQTRARYFLFIPWIMQACASKNLSVAEVPKEIRRRETQLIEALLKGNPAQSGIIGREAKGTLKRMPSNVYWRGLQTLKIRLDPGSIDQFYRRMSDSDSGSKHIVRTDDGEPMGTASRLWHSALPARPPELFTKCLFELATDEAEFLADRIRESCAGSLLEMLLTRSEQESDADYAWEHPLLSELPKTMQAIVEHGRCFAMCTYAGPLIYSRMVAELKGADEIVETATEYLEEWRNTLNTERRALHHWNRSDFWALLQRLNPRLSSRTRDFSERWTELALEDASTTPLWERKDVRQMIVVREQQLKGARSRLRQENIRGRDRWQHDGTGGPMDFRWRQTQVILNDIIRGQRGISSLSGGEDA